MPMSCSHARRKLASVGVLSSVGRWRTPANVKVNWIRCCPAAATSARATPGERNVLAGLPAPIPRETEGIRTVDFRSSPRRDHVGTGTNLGAGRIDRLNALARRCRRTAERLRACFDLARYRRTPAGQVACHFELDWCEGDAAHFGKGLRELCGPATRLATEDHLHGVALGSGAALIDEDRDRGLGARPEIALEKTERQHVESVERDISVGAFAHVPHQNAVAITECGCLGEFAGARDI